MNPTSRLSALLLCLASAGCFYPAERGKMMESRLAQLEGHRQQTEAELTRQREQIAKQLLEVQSTLDKLDRASRRTGADMGVQLEQMQADMNALRGQVEQYQFRIGELEAALAQVKEEQAKAAAAALEEPKKKELERPADKQAFAELVSATLPDDAKLGRKLGGEWLKKWPKDPLAAKVYHDLGVSYFKESNWTAALGEFKEVLEGFSKSAQAPSALLKSSECFANLKMPKESRLMLETLVADYSKSADAKVAKERLAALKKTKSQKKER